MSQLTKGQSRRVMYIECKAEAGDRGKARIGWVTFSKSSRSIYYQNQRFERLKGRGMAGNYFDVDTGDEYWISGIKKSGTNRHRAGGGPVEIDDDAREEYQKLRAD